MRADKHLGECTEPCKYNMGRKCAFSLRNNLGCFLDEDVKLQAGTLLMCAREINSIEAAKSVLRAEMEK